MARDKVTRAERLLTASLATASGLIGRCELSGELTEQTAAARRIIAERSGSVSHQAQLVDAAISRLVLAARGSGVELERSEVALAVRYFAADLERRHPGHTIELRIPPLVAVQLGALSEGPAHTRGTPPNVAETDADTWLDLVSGQLSWADAVASARLRASGAHVADLATMIAPG